MNNINEGPVKSFYESKVVNTKEGKFLDIFVKVPLHSGIKDLDKEKLNLFLKTLYAESKEKYKVRQNMPDSDNDLKVSNNTLMLRKFLTPIAYYSVVIVYKRFTRGRLGENNSFRENLKPRLKAFGIAFGYYCFLSLIYHFLEGMALGYNKMYVMNELLNSNDEKLYQEYEKFKFDYIYTQNTTNNNKYV